MKKKTTLEKIQDALKDMPPDDLAQVRAFIEGMIAARRIAAAGKDPTVTTETANPGQARGSAGKKKGR